MLFSSFDLSKWSIADLFEDVFALRGTIASLKPLRPELTLLKNKSKSFVETTIIISPFYGVL